MNGKKYLISLFFTLGCLVGFMFFNNYFNEDKTEELSKEQVKALIEMNALPVYYTLNQNANDVDIGLTYSTSKGDCHIYRDIFGRYYCRY